MIGKKSEVEVMLQFIMELILISIMGIALISYSASRASLEQVKERVIVRELALLLGTMYTSTDFVSMDYTFFGSPNYLIRYFQGSIAISDYSSPLSSETPIRFPFIHPKDAGISFHERLQMLRISMDKGHFSITQQNEAD
jgi:hypothetical protein